MSSVAARLGAFALGLVLVFAAAFGVGRAVGPLDSDPGAPSAPHGAEHGEMGP